MATFSDFSLGEEILAALSKMGYETPTAIQQETLPLILSGKDVLALAQTGSGKTAACAIPLCHLVDIKKKAIQVLIVVPTRELALQYATETQKIGKIKKVAAFAVLGGESFSIQGAKLKDGVHICVATPGRLIDLIYSRSIDLTHVTTLVLDEADEMLSMGFYDDLEFIMNCLIQKHQTLLFSATMPQGMAEMARRHMHEPAEVMLLKEQGTPREIEHRFHYCENRGEKRRALEEHLQDTTLTQALVFCASRLDCEELARSLKGKCAHIDFLHGGLPQVVRQSLTQKFRQGKIKILVVTDVAARGLDFSGISHVFMYHVSKDPETYVHRAGRTGRQGKSGVTVTLVTGHEMPALQRVLELIAREPIWLVAPPAHGHGGEKKKDPLHAKSGPRRGGHPQRHREAKKKRGEST